MQLDGVGSSLAFLVAQNFGELDGNVRAENLLDVVLNCLDLLWRYFGAFGPFCIFGYGTPGVGVISIPCFFAISHCSSGV